MAAIINQETQNAVLEKLENNNTLTILNNGTSVAAGKQTSLYGYSAGQNENEAILELRGVGSKPIIGTNSMNTAVAHAIRV
jgi:hypothetical protein